MEYLTLLTGAAFGAALTSIFLKLKGRIKAKRELEDKKQKAPGTENERSTEDGLTISKQLENLLNYSAANKRR